MSYSPMADNKLLLLPAVAAATAVVGLTIAQSDVFSRRLLHPEQLQAKRLHEYKYRWDQSNDKALLRAHLYLAGGVDAHEANQMTSKRSSNSSSNLWDESGLQALIQEWMQQDKKRGNDATTPFPRILGMIREEESREWLVDLYHPQSGTYSLPLQRFGLLLADVLEDTMTTTALCFVADASSGLASQFVPDLLEASKAGVVRRGS
jgi:hypothetical protein